jgi:hypothetical protein
MISTNSSPSVIPIPEYTIEETLDKLVNECTELT